MKKRDYFFDKQMAEILKEEKRQSEERQKEFDKILSKAMEARQSINRNCSENKPLFNGIENEIHEVADLCRKSVYFDKITEQTEFDNMSAEEVYFNLMSTEKRLGLFCTIGTIRAIAKISELIRQRGQVKSKELLRSEIRISEKIKDTKLDIEILKDKIEKISDVDDFLKCRETIKYWLGELERDTTEYEVYKALSEGLREEVENGEK